MGCDLQHWHRGSTRLLGVENDDDSISLVSFTSVWDAGPRWGVQLQTSSGERIRLEDVALSTRAPTGLCFGAFVGCVWVRLADGRWTCVGAGLTEAEADFVARKIAEAWTRAPDIDVVQRWLDDGVEAHVYAAETEGDLPLTALSIAERLRSGEPVSSIAASVRSDVDQQQHRRSVAVARCLARGEELALTVREIAELVRVVPSKRAATRRASAPVTTIGSEAEHSALRGCLGRLRDRGIVDMIRRQGDFQRWSITEIGRLWLRDIDRVEQRLEMQEAI